MENKILRCGVVGCGRGAAVAGCGFGNPKCKIVAACDHNEEILAHCKEYFESMNATDIIYMSIVKMSSPTHASSPISAK